LHLDCAIIPVVANVTMGEDGLSIMDRRDRSLLPPAKSGEIDNVHFFDVVIH
jgi:hypothetical protein